MTGDSRELFTLHPVGAGINNTSATDQTLRRRWQGDRQPARSPCEAAGRPLSTRMWRGQDHPGLGKRLDLVGQPAGSLYHRRRCTQRRGRADHDGIGGRCPVPATSLSPPSTRTSTATPSTRWKAGGLEVTSFTDSHILGTVRSEGGALFTSIPYDPGWRVKVDGTPVETYGVSEAFLAFDVPAGEHTVELRYTPQGLWAGILFSGINLCLVILLAILTHIRLQRKRDARLFARFDIPSPDSLRPPAAGGGNASYAGPPSGAGPAFPDGNTPPWTAGQLRGGFQFS